MWFLLCMPFKLALRLLSLILAWYYWKLSHQSINLQFAKSFVCHVWSCDALLTVLDHRNVVRITNFWNNAIIIETRTYIFLFLLFKFTLWRSKMGGCLLPTAYLHLHLLISFSSINSLDSKLYGKMNGKICICVLLWHHQLKSLDIRTGDLWSNSVFTQVVEGYPMLCSPSPLDQKQKRRKIWLSDHRPPYMSLIW